MEYIVVLIMKIVKLFDKLSPSLIQGMLNISQELDIQYIINLHVYEIKLKIERKC